MFIKYKEEKIVNLRNVSNIYVDLHDNGEGKVIFNMNYSVKIFGNKFIPDYVYWNFSTEEELQSIKDIFEPSISYLQWVHPVEKGQRFVNPNCISSISLDTHKNRVIFNLNYNVTHPKDYNKLISDFIFFDFSSVQSFEDFKNTWL